MNYDSEIKQEGFSYQYENFFFQKDKKKIKNNIFLSIADLIRSYINTNTEEEKVVQELIEHKSWNLVGTMIDNGYQLTTNQLKEINKAYDIAIEGRETFIEGVAKLLDYNVPFTKETMHKLFFNPYIQIYLNRYMVYHEEAKYISEEIISKKYYHNDYKPTSSTYTDNMSSISCNTVLKKIYEYLDNPITKKDLFANWIELVKQDKKFTDNLVLLRPYSIFKHDFIPTLSLKQYNQLILHFNKFPETEEKNLVLEDLNKNIKDIHYNKVENLINNIKKVNVITNADFNNFDSRTVNLVTNNEIPERAKAILNDIKDSYKNLGQEKDTLSNCWDEIEIIMNKHVPLIIKKYSAIDPNYRENLNNGENKNAQEILIASLSNIKECFEEKLKECNQNKLHDLSASHKYTKQLVKIPK